MDVIPGRLFIKCLYLKMNGAALQLCRSDLCLMKIILTVVLANGDLCMQCAICCAFYTHGNTFPLLINSKQLTATASSIQL